MEEENGTPTNTNSLENTEIEASSSRAQSQTDIEIDDAEGSSDFDDNSEDRERLAYDTSSCVACSNLLELIQSPVCESSGMLMVELDRGDSLSIMCVFSRSQNHRNCQVLQKRYAEVHGLIRSLIVQVIMPLMKDLVGDCDALIRMSNMDGSSEDLSEFLSDSLLEQMNQSTGTGSFRLRGYSLEERTELLSFLGRALGDDFLLYRCFPRSTINNQIQRAPVLHMVRCCVDSGILGAMNTIFQEAITLVPVSMAHAMLRIMMEIRKHPLIEREQAMLRREMWGVRQGMLEYMGRMAGDDEEILRNDLFRTMADALWRIGIEDVMDSEDSTPPMDAAGVDLAVKHCKSPILKSRIVGLTQLCNHVQCVSDFVGKTSRLTMTVDDSFDSLMPVELGSKLQSVNVVEVVFGASAHPELLKQAFPLLDFMATYKMLRVEDLDCIWGAVKKKDCAKTVMELLAWTAKSMDWRLLTHLQTLLQTLSCSQHNQTSLSLIYQVTSVLWKLVALRKETGRVLRSATGLSLDPPKTESCDSDYSDPGDDGKTPSLLEFEQFERELESEEDVEEWREREEVEADQGTDGDSGSEDEGSSPLPPPQASGSRESQEGANKRPVNSPTGGRSQYLESKKAKWDVKGRADVGTEYESTPKPESQSGGGHWKMGDGSTLPSPILSRYMEPRWKEADREEERNRDLLDAAIKRKGIEEREESLREVEDGEESNGMSSDRATTSADGSDRLGDLDPDEEEELYDFHEEEYNTGRKERGYVPNSSESLMEGTPDLHLTSSSTSQGSHFPMDDLSEVSSPNVTLLWDLLMQAEQEECLGREEERMAIKHILDLCRSFQGLSNQFIIPCIENLENNKCSRVCLELLPRLMECESGTRASLPATLLHLDDHHGFIDVFLNNAYHYFRHTDEARKPSHILEVDCRLRFLDFLCSHSDVPLLIERKGGEMGMVWKCMMEDEGYGRAALCQWLLSHLSGPLSSFIAQIMLDKKLVKIAPGRVSMTELSLIQRLLSTQKTGKEREECLRLLWSVFLSNIHTNVSLQAMQALSSHYLHSANPEEAAKKEDEFVRICAEHLDRALSGVFHQSFPIINRALVMLKSHVEAFKKRYSFHLRMRELEGKERLTPHALLDPASPTLVAFETGNSEKGQVRVSPGYTLGDLRADISHWWTTKRRMDPGLSGPPPNVTVTKDGVPSVSTTPALLSALGGHPDLRLLYGGRELSRDLDDTALSELGIVHKSTVLVQVSNPREGSVPKPPESAFTPMHLLLSPERWNLLMRVVEVSLANFSEADLEKKIQCWNLARSAWEVLLLLPTFPEHLNRLDQCLLTPKPVDGAWRGLVEEKRRHHLLYTLQILDPTLHQNTLKKMNFMGSGGVVDLLEVLLSPSSPLLPTQDGWSEWNLESIVRILRIVYFCSLAPGETSRTIPLRQFPKTELDSSTDPGALPLLDMTVFKSKGMDLVQFLLHLLGHLADDCDWSLSFTLGALRVNAVTYSFMLLTSLLYTEQSLQGGVSVDGSGLARWLKKVTFQCSDGGVRQECVAWLRRLCLGHSSQRGFPGKGMIVPVLTGLLSSLSEASTIPHLPPDLDSPKREENGLKEPYGPSPFSYFWLMACLVDGLRRAEVEHPDSLLVVGKQAIEYLKSRGVRESQGGSPDQVLRGLLTLLAAIAKAHPQWKSSERGKGLCRWVLGMLFQLPGVDGKEPQCKTPDSRLPAFHLLLELSRGSSANFATLFNFLTEQNSKDFHEEYGWDYWPRDHGRSPCGYVGIQNLGATCYMATALQHLYMIPEFRRGILSYLPQPNQKNPAILSELQRLFTFLYKSKRKAYNPETFCKVYRMENQPTNTGEQKDMNECFTDLITKTEEMNPDLKRMVKDLFCGVMSNNVVSESCPHVSTTTELFYTVTCQVANMKNIDESLAELTVADTLDGDNMYTCSECGKKVKAKKRACFKTLPRILSFNTMRYTFNMETMTREKVNTHFSFPPTIDMKPYMETELLPSRVPAPDPHPAPSLVYHLIGVTVHTGTAEGGHYYSYIRDPTLKDKWYSFNDAEVKLWNQVHLAAECFGGAMMMQRGSYMDSWRSGDGSLMESACEKVNSAYMVFYARVPEGGEFREEGLCLAPDLSRWIWDDNARFIRDKFLFDHQYFSFVHQLCSEVPKTLEDSPELALRTTQLSIRFVMETLIHAKEKPTIHSWIELVVKQLSASHSASQWFLETMIADNAWPLELLVKCPGTGCRQIFEKLVSHVFIHLHHTHSHLFLHPHNMTRDIGSVEPGEVGQDSCVTRFIHTLLDLIRTPAILTEAEMRRLPEYFSLLLTFAKGGETSSRFLLMAGTIRTIIHFYMTKAAQDLERRESGGDDGELGGLLCLMGPGSVSRSVWLSPAVEKMTELVVALLEASQDPRTHSLNIHPLDMEALLGGSGFPFLMQQIRDACDVHLAARLLLVVSNNRPQVKSKLVQAILAKVKQQTRDEECGSLVGVLSELCGMDGQKRTKQDFLGIILFHMMALAEQKPLLCLSWLEKNASSCPMLYDYLLGHMGLWVKKYLLEHRTCSVRMMAGQVVLSLIPTESVKKTYIQYQRRSDTGHVHPSVQNIPAEALQTLHRVYGFLLSLMPEVMKSLANPVHFGHARVVSYFTALRACLVGRDEKAMVVDYLDRIWFWYKKYYHKQSSTTCIPNKQALVMFWYFASMDCPEMVQAALRNGDLFKSFFNSFILIKSDEDVVAYNKQYVTAIYGLTRMMCAESAEYCRHIMSHENLPFAIKSVAWKTGDFSKASEDIVRILELCCKVPDQGAVNEFKRNVVWPCMRQVMEDPMNFFLLLKVIGFLVETPEDKMFLLEKDVLNILSDSFLSVFTMYHNATACNVVGEVCELLKRLDDFLTRLEQWVSVKGIESCQMILSHWRKERMVGMKLVELLNSHVPPTVRTLSMNCVGSMVRLLGPECPFVLPVVAAAIHSHTRWIPGSGGTPDVGPYFPKRSYDVPDASLNVHPPEAPLDPQTGQRSTRLDMTLSPMQLEAAQGVDVEYDKALEDYFLPYHQLMDTILKAAVNTPEFTHVTSFVDMSVRVGLEGALLHFPLFPKLWMDIKRKTETDERMKEWLDALEQQGSFRVFLQLILCEEHSTLNNEHYLAFFKEYFTKGVGEALGLEMKRRIWERCMDSFTDVSDTWNRTETARKVRLCLKLTGTIRVMELMMEEFVKQGLHAESSWLTILQELVMKISHSLLHEHLEENPEKIGEAQGILEVFMRQFSQCIAQYEAKPGRKE